jgi:hypothetical protein
MKNIKTLQIILGINIILGLILMVGGIVTGKHGASGIGLVIAAINVQQLIQSIKKEEKK